MRLWNRHLLLEQPQLHPALRDMTRHRHLRERGLMLGDQTLPNPPGGVPLLARGVLIGDEPGVDHRDPLLDRWARPRRIDLARRGNRVGEGWTHRPTMRAMTIRQLTDRQVIEPPVSSDLLEQFHA